jgi:hypothetical protein
MDGLFQLAQHPSSTDVPDDTEGGDLSPVVWQGNVENDRRYLPPATGCNHVFVQLS